MTKKLTHNEKMFSKLTSGLNATWNCDGNCGGCIFEVTDTDMEKLIAINTYTMTCGAIAIRKLAKKFFTNKKATKFMDRI